MKLENMNDRSLWVGDIEEYKVYKRDREHFTDYAIFNDGKVVAYAVLEQNVVENVFVVPEHRKRGLFSMFLFFLKQNEGLSQIIMGMRHSKDTLEAIKRIARRFNIYWSNGKEKVPYSPETTDQFYSETAPTKWKLILENDGDFTDVPKKFDFRLAKTFYTPLLD